MCDKSIVKRLFEQVKDAVSVYVTEGMYMIACENDKHSVARDLTEEVVKDIIDSGMSVSFVLAATTATDILDMEGTRFDKGDITET